MDYDKSKDSLESALTKVEKKAIHTFNRNLNFIKNLRKYITNESTLFEGVILGRAIKLGIILIVAEVLLSLFGYTSLLGLIPKILATTLLFIYTKRDKLRRNL